MSFWDDDAGYDIRDPKHPDFVDRAFHAADHFRKADRENAAAPAIQFIQHDESQTGEGPCTTS